MNKKYYDEEIESLSDFDEESNPEKSAVTPNMYGFKGFHKPNQSFDSWRQISQKWSNLEKSFIILCKLSPLKG